MDDTGNDVIGGIMAAVREQLAGQWPARRVTPSPGSYTRVPSPAGGGGYQRRARPAGRHVAQDGTELKRCGHCRRLRPLADFCSDASRLDGLSCDCRTCAGENSRRWHARNRDKVRAQQARWRQAQRDAVFDHYGRVCACPGCGATDDLTIDHVNGGGEQHRRQLNGMNLYRWLVVTGFPAGFQVLCRSCNLAKGRNPACLVDHA